MPERKNKESALVLKAVIANDCLRCGLCRQVCPVGAVVIKNRRFVVSPACIACANCLELCPVACIELVWDQPQSAQ